MDLLSAISSKKRLQILRLLSRDDSYVSQIMEELGIDGKNAKHHLDSLEESGLIESYRKGRRNYYSLKKEVRLEILPPSEGKFSYFRRKVMMRRSDSIFLSNDIY